MDTPPQINVTSTTTVKVAPVPLTAAQMDAIIAALQGLGINSNIPLTSANLGSIIVRRNLDGSFTANITANS